MKDKDKERVHHEFLQFKSHRFLIFSLLITLALFYVANIYPFLAMTKPVNGEILVVEAWIPSYMLEQAVFLINQGSYKTIAIVGGPLKGETSKLIEQTTVYRCKNELVKLGIPAERIEMVPVWHLKRNRTFTLAKTLNSWLKDNIPSVEAVDIFTAGVHGRKSYLLYQRVLGNSIRVGIYSALAEEFSGKIWFESMRGIYLVLRNTVGYFKALIFTF